MAMHDDVPLGLDLAGGLGCLPLAPDAIRAAFAPHQPGWTIVDALRVLGDERADAHRALQPVLELITPAWPGRKIKLPPLPKKIDQLSLFD